MSRPLRVLIVEDSPDDTRLMLHELRRGGFEPSWERVATQEAMEDALARGPWDVVLADCRLPAFDAPAALAVLRQAGLDLPFIVITGTVGEEHAAPLMRAGAGDVLLKGNLARLAPAVERELREAGGRRARQAAERDASRLAAIVRSTDDPIIGTDPDGTVNFWNPAAERLYGWAAAEVAGRPVSVIVPPDRAGELEDVLRQVRRGGHVAPFESVRRRKDGRDVHVALTTSPVLDAAGRVVGVSEIARDVTARKQAEEALRRDALLLASVRDSVIVTDLGGVVTYWNDGATRLFGWAAEEMVGRPLEERFPPEARAAVREMTRAIAGGEEFAGEFEDYRKDGSRVWIEARVSRITDPAGNPVGVMGLAHDISRSKRVEDALRQSEAHYHFLAESFPQLVWMTRPDGRADYLNRRCEAYTGLPAGVMLGWEWLRAVHPDDSGPTRQRWESALRTGETYRAEFRLRRADGVYRWHAAEGVPLRDDAGRVVRWFGTCTDVEDRKQAEGQKSELTAHIRLLLESTGEGIYGVDDQGRCTFINRAGAAMLGFTPEELVGREMHALVHHTRADGSPYPWRDCPIYASFRDGRSVHTDDEVLWRKDGTSFPARYAAYPTASGGFRGAVVTFTDVTERKRLEEQYRQAQKMEAVGRLAGGVAHDFNNLLTVINGFSELVLGELPPGHPARELLREVVAAGDRAAGLTRQLLAFSRKSILEPRPLDLRALVADLEKMLRRVIGEDVQLAVRSDPGPSVVRADPGQLEQVILNLVVNARDAMPQGGRLTLEVRDAELDEAYCRAHPDARPGPHVLLAVSDTGCGMDPATLAHAFEPFFTTKGERGTGLGLATVHGIVQQSGGHVAVETEVGRGTTFRVYLPRVGQRPAAKSAPILGKLPRGTETVLLVEDEDAVRALGRHVLHGCGYTVLEARDGAEAARAAGQHRGRVDLLVTDVVMPRMGGGEVAERVRELHPGAKVLFLSGYTDDAVVRHGIRESEVAFLQKPYSPASLAAKVREVLDA